MTWGSFMRRALKFFSDLPIARKLLLASVIPVLTVVSLSIVTYRSVETFSEDESELNTLYLSQRLAAEYLRLVVDLETGFRGLTSKCANTMTTGLSLRRSEVWLLSSSRRKTR
jgi:hypothetical protein